MAHDSLVSAPVERGRRVLEAARKQGIRLQGAFWRHDSDPDRWRLVLVAPDAEGGATESLLRLVRVLDYDDVSDVEFRPPSDPVFTDVQNAPGVTRADGKHVTSLISAGRYIDDAFLYAL